MYAHTVDGRNPAPVDMVNIPLFIGFHTCQTCDRRISGPSNSRFSPPKQGDAFLFAAGGWTTSSVDSSPNDVSYVIRRVSQG